MIGWPFFCACDSKETFDVQQTRTDHQNWCGLLHPLIPFSNLHTDWLVEIDWMAFFVCCNITDWNNFRINRSWKDHQTDGGYENQPHQLPQQLLDCLMSLEEFKFAKVHQTKFCRDSKPDTVILFVISKRFGLICLFWKNLSSNQAMVFWILNASRSTKMTKIPQNQIQKIHKKEAKQDFTIASNTKLKIKRKN